MILDASGRELKRAIGFARCLRIVRTPEPTSDLIATISIECEEADVFEERAKEDDGQ